MKKIIKAMLCTLLAFACFMPQVMAAPVPVKVRGTAAAGDMAHAQQDAQKKAVYRVLSTMLDNSDKDNDVVNKIMSHYQEYTGKVSVNQKVTAANKLYLNATVMVDTDKLRNAVHDSVAKEQKAHRDDVSAFLIRAVDEKGDLIVENRNGKCVPNANIAVQNVYKATYKNRGFNTEASDEFNAKVYDIFNAWTLKNKKQTYAEFLQNIEGLLSGPLIEVTIPVIGEVRITKCQETAKAFDLEAVVQLTAKDMMAAENGKVITEFVENYGLTIAKESTEFVENYGLTIAKESGFSDDAARKLAIKELLYKAAMNSSSYLAGQMLAYWHK